MIVCPSRVSRSQTPAFGSIQFQAPNPGFTRYAQKCAFRLRRVAWNFGRLGSGILKLRHHPGYTPGADPLPVIFHRMARARTSIVAALFGVAAGIVLLTALRGRETVPPVRPADDPAVAHLL